MAALLSRLSAPNLLLPARITKDTTTSIRAYAADAGADAQRRAEAVRSIALDVGLYTIFCYQYCMVYGIQKGGRGGVVYWPIAVQ